MRMPGFETSMGGPGGPFPETTAGASFDALCARYWKPVYGYLRAAFGEANEEAKDLTQAFFAQLLEDGSLERYDPERGRLRAYLKVLLRSFVGHAREAGAALKRGGGRAVVSLDDPDVPWSEVVADPKAADPEAVFDRLWRVELAERVLARWRGRCPELRARIYDAYVLAPEPDRPTYAALAARLGIGEDDVRNHLSAARAELRQAAREELPDGDWDELFGTRGPG